MVLERICWAWRSVLCLAAADDEACPNVLPQIYLLNEKECKKWFKNIIRFIVYLHVSGQTPSTLARGGLVVDLLTSGLLQNEYLKSSKFIAMLHVLVVGKRSVHFIDLNRDSSFLYTGLSFYSSKVMLHDWWRLTTGRGRWCTITYTTWTSSQHRPRPFTISPKQGSIHLTSIGMRALIFNYMPYVLLLWA